jgi:hypothetical protein
MSSPLLLSLAFTTGVIGMAWFALAKLPHWRQVTGEEWQHGGTRSTLRFAGAVALALSLGLCVAADHITMSFLVWIMILAAGALGVALLLAFRPRALRWIALRIDR